MKDDNASSPLTPATRNNTTATSSSPSPPPPTFLEKIQAHPYIVAVAGVAFVVHLSALLSLPPAIRGRGAPFLPTTKSHGNAMFTQLHQQIETVLATTTKAQSATAKKRSRFLERAQNNSLVFVDLGSGDGRLVFRAAREGIFAQSIGYEINPGNFH